MARVRVNTTVNGQLLNDARAARPGVTDADLLDEALAALLTKDRATSICRLLRDLPGLPRR